jgi:hypothetical protein
LKIILWLNRNSLASVWSPVKSKRFKDTFKNTLEKPEPGTYNPSDKHSENDCYILSTFKNPGVKRIIPLSQLQLKDNTRFFKSRTGKF